jgi:hypothetical protein
MAVTLNCLKARAVGSVRYYCMLQHRRRELTFVYLYLTVDIQCHLEVLERVKDGIGYIKLLSAERRENVSLVRVLNEMPNLTQAGASVLTLVVIYAKLDHIPCAYSSLNVREDGILDFVPRYLEAR